MLVTRRLTYPPDIDAAYEAWGANCGPCSLAASLGRTLHDVRQALYGFEGRGYCNPTHIKDALDRLGVHYRVIGARKPACGLVFVQWGGHEAKPVKVQYRFTHWVAVEGNTVFEVNAPELTTWREWQMVMPRLIQEHGRGNGTFFIRSALELLEE